MQGDKSEEIRERALQAFSREDYGEAEGILREMVCLRPAEAVWHCMLAHSLRELGRLDEAIEEYHQSIELDGDMVLAYSGLGQAFLDKSQPSDAEAAFRRRLEIRPDSPGYTFLAEALQRQDKMSEARVCLERAIECDPEYDEAYTNLAGLYYTSDPDKAENLYRKALEIDPDSLYANYGLGLLLERLERFDEAGPILSKACAAVVSDAEVLHEIAGAFDRMGRHDKAEEQYKNLVELCRSLIRARDVDSSNWRRTGDACYRLDRLQEAQMAYRKAVEMDPRCLAAWFGLGCTHVKQSNWTEAAEAFRRAVEIDSRNANAWWRLGKVYQEQSRHRQAILAFREAAEIRPEDAAIWGLLGDACYDAGEMDESVDAYKRALEIDPTEAVMWCLFAGACHGAGEPGEAVNAYKKALEIDPTNASAWFDLGAVRFRQGECTDAVMAFEKALAVDPGYLAAHAGLIRSLLAVGRVADAKEWLTVAIRDGTANAQRWDDLYGILMEGGHLAELETLLRPISSENPDCALPHFLLAGVLERLGQPVAAQHEYEAAISISPHSACYLSLAGLMKSTGRYAEAEDAYETAVALDAENVDGYVQYANLLIELGRNQEAKRLLSKALALDPGDPEARRAEEQLTG